MSSFDPDRPSIVFDELNHVFFRWKPEYAADYRQHANLKFDEERGVVEHDGDLLACWFPESDAAALGFREGVDRVEAPDAPPSD